MGSCTLDQGCAPPEQDHIAISSIQLLLSATHNTKHGLFANPTTCGTDMDSTSLSSLESQA